MRKGVNVKECQTANSLYINGTLNFVLYSTIGRQLMWLAEHYYYNNFLGSFQQSC